MREREKDRQRHKQRTRKRETELNRQTRIGQLENNKWSVSIYFLSN